MRALVTGAAGFVGSHLVERLVRDEWDIVAVDCLTPYYALSQKQANRSALAEFGVEVAPIDLTVDELEPWLEGADVVFHQAGQPGVRASWDDFEGYVKHNVLATERLLAAARQVGTRRLVYASSSSIYGDAARYPTAETDLPAPKSPYGVTKLAAEHLVGVYARSFGVPAVSLRYFTVFGPRQRPDMAMHRLVESALHGHSFPLFGDGEQIRDFTYVGDVIEANLRAAVADADDHAVFNIAGGGSVTLNEVISIVESLTGEPIALDRRPPQAGDVIRTGGSIDRARESLGWAPSVTVSEGLAHQVRWHVERLEGRHHARRQ